MSKSDRLSHIIQVYLEGDLELDTAVAELVHVYVERGWRFSLIAAECVSTPCTRREAFVQISCRPAVECRTVRGARSLLVAAMVGHWYGTRTRLQSSHTECLREQSSRAAAL